MIEDHNLPVKAWASVGLFGYIFQNANPSRSVERILLMANQRQQLVAHAMPTDKNLVEASKSVMMAQFGVDVIPKAECEPVFTMAETYLMVYYGQRDQDMPTNFTMCAYRTYLDVALKKFPYILAIIHAEHDTQNLTHVFEYPELIV